MITEDTLSSIPTYELDYNFLIERFKNSRFPRNRISYLLKTNRLTRIKKGLYVKTNSRFSSLLLANLIYGPSYVSQEYALFTYGMIAERAHTVTSMILGKKIKTFTTPIGNFTYESLPAHLYTLGIRRAEASSTQPYLIATPEKALADLIWKDRSLKTADDLATFLDHDLRISIDNFPLSHTRMREIARAFDTPSIYALADLISKRKCRE